MESSLPLHMIYPISWASRLGVCPLRGTERGCPRPRIAETRGRIARPLRGPKTSGPLSQVPPLTFHPSSPSSPKATSASLLGQAGCFGDDLAAEVHRVVGHHWRHLVVELEESLTTSTGTTLEVPVLVGGGGGN